MLQVFVLNRKEDVSGISGTGVVAYGVVFPDGKAVLWWKNLGSIGIYDSLEYIKVIHGHDGKTVIQPKFRLSVDDAVLV